MRMFFAALALLALPAATLAFPSGAEIAALQSELSPLPVGERIAAWAEAFVGTPYDPDPDGEYVTLRAIVADSRVDCMYHAFRSVELALGGTPDGAVDIAIDKRFITRGVLKDGVVQNYGERFQYAEDMIRSGKWGVEVTGYLGPTEKIAGSRGVDEVVMLPKRRIPDVLSALKSGDIVFFVKDPEKRAVGEVIGHIGVIKREGERAFLIHASGSKKRGGEVKKVLFSDYSGDMPFVGIKVTRFGEN
jgi:hypothetical protein